MVIYIIYILLSINLSSFYCELGAIHFFKKMNIGDLTLGDYLGNIHVAQSFPIIVEIYVLLFC